MANIEERNLGAGIDALSPENKIGEGFLEDALNADPTPEGSIKKRQGYQSYAGYLPFRVSRMTQDGNEVCFYFDSSVDISSVDLSTIRSTPLVVYGKTTQGSGEFTTTETCRYYDSFTVDSRRQAQVGTNNVAIPQSEHGFSSDNFFLGYAQSLSTTDNSNTQILFNTTEIDDLSFDVDVSFINGTGDIFDYFIFWTDKSPETGVTYVEEINLIPTAGVASRTITAATHQLSNTNIIPKAYELDAGVWREIEVESFEIAPNGDVAIELATEVTKDYKFILTRAPAANEVTGTAGAGATVDVLIENLEQPFLFAACYLEDLGTGARELVYPNAISVNDVTKTATITFINESADTKNFSVFWEEVRLVANSLCVTGSTSASIDELAPQLTLWGLSHAQAYGSSPISNRVGWTNHIDSYRSLGEGRLIAGLGGNLFTAVEKDSMPSAYQPCMPSYYPLLRARADVNTYIGPAFYDTADSPQRTRGYIKFDGAAQGYGRANTITYDSANGWIRYDISAPNLSVVGTLSTVISTTSGLEDRLTVKQAGYALNNGTFKIKQVTTGPDLLSIWVENSQNDGEDWNEQDACAEVAVLSDRITFLADSPFIAGDILTSDLFGEEYAFEAVISLGNTCLLANALDPVEVPSGLRFVGSRIGRVIPLRELDGTASVEGIVLGDELSYSEVSRSLKVTFVNPQSDIGLTIVGDGDIAVATLSSSSTEFLREGARILILRAGDFSGEQTVVEILSPTSFSFSHTYAGSSAGTLKGHTIEVNETDTFSWQDSVTSATSLTVSRRWFPIEAPEVTGDLLKKTYYRHFDSFDYAEQKLLRSVMVSDNMYFVNGQDEVLKYDGVSLYRAGLPRWQPQLFSAVKPNASAKILTNNGDPIALIDGTRTAGETYFEVAAEDQNYFKVGNRVKFNNHATIYTITDITLVDHGGNDHVVIRLDKPLTSDVTTSETVNLVKRRAYYFRLNAIDANSNVTASAVIGLNDFTIELSEDAAVELKLVGLPPLDNYNYDNIEIEVYATKLDLLGDYYRIGILKPDYNGNDGYLTFLDTNSDDTLTDVDPINGALLGAEVGTQWNQPLRAEYVTSVDNRLVLGNVKDYPKWQLEMARATTGLPLEAANLTGDIYLFKKNILDTGTATDIENRIRFEFVSAATASITNVTTVPNTSITLETTTTPDAGDWVYLYRDATTDDYSLEAAGWYQVDSVNAGVSFTILDANAPASAGATNVNAYVKATDGADIPVFLGEDGNYTTLTGNQALSIEYQAAIRLSNAINAVMRQYESASFEPWLLANAGSEFGAGVLEITQPKVFDTTASLILPAFSGYQIFVNNYKRVASEEIAAATRVYPSRVLYSYQNYPEIFDNPLAVVVEESASTIDVNSSDGQQITGIIPFFALTADGGAGAFLTIFKTNSIYIADLTGRLSGRVGFIQKIDSRGIGCTAPYSIASVRNGIAFANESGIYRLTRSLQVDYFGDKLERKWRSDVSKADIGLAAGHYYAFGNKYKFSFTGTGASSNDQVWVYDTVRESEQREGSWTRYTNHPAIGWANLSSDAFFASTIGEVFKIRNLGEPSDYRDDSSAIVTEVTFRANNFGSAAIRKLMDGVVADFKAWNNSTSTTLSFAAELRDDFRVADRFKIEKAFEVSSGLDQQGDVKITTIRFAADRRRVVYFQVKLTNDGLDDEVELTGLTYNVRPINEKGIIEARTTLNG